MNGPTIDRRWFGVLTADNLDEVAVVVREILSGSFAIAEALYCDSSFCDLRLISADCQIDSRWTSEPQGQPVRVYRDKDSAWLGFSAGGYLWTFDARKDSIQDHEDYRYAYFVFEHNKFTVTERAPAGLGHLHKRAFGAHHKEASETGKETGGVS